MRIAVLADIHGNLEAFEACLARVDELDVDLTVIAGDLLNGAPDSLACWQLARDRGFPVLRGNHERYLFDLGTPAEDPLWRTERFGPVRWAAARFDRRQLEEMRRLPLCWRPEGAPELLVVHASARNDTDHIHPHTPAALVDEAFGQANARLIVRAHNHMPSVRHWRHSLIISAGSVGMPLDGTTTAKMLLLERDAGGEWRYEHVAVPYDVSAALQRFRESGYLEEAGAMSRMILREIATGAHQMTPFIRYWEQEAPEVSSLEEAVERFLAAY